jgi:pSer/pThr/pTyr-binding forkhead associated (FHA) protein
MVDLDSDTGVVVNDESVFRKELNDEDWIKAGNTLFRIKKR